MSNPQEGYCAEGRPETEPNREETEVLAHYRSGDHAEKRDGEQHCSGMQGTVTGDLYQDRLPRLDADPVQCGNVLEAGSVPAAAAGTRIPKRRAGVTANSQLRATSRYGEHSACSYDPFCGAFSHACGIS